MLRNTTQSDYYQVIAFSFAQLKTAPNLELFSFGGRHWIRTSDLYDVNVTL